MSGEPYPKPVKRPRGAARLARKQRRRRSDPDAFARARTSSDECAACGRRPMNVHHVLPKGAPHHGDDVYENFVLLCGTGTTGCHGSFHGNPYVDSSGRRWESDDVRRAIGETILATRPDTVAYVIDTLGDGPGRDYLRRRYFLEAP